MVLTVDLIRGSMELWNRNMGQIVDEPGRHGTFQDVITEGNAVGFELVQSEVVREWGESRSTSGSLSCVVPIRLDTVATCMASPSRNRIFGEL